MNTFHAFIGGEQNRRFYLLPVQEVNKTFCKHYTSQIGCFHFVSGKVEKEERVWYLGAVNERRFTGLG